MTIVTWIGITSTIPVDIAYPPTGDNLPSGGLGLFWFCVVTNALVLLAYFTYFVMSCIGMASSICYKAGPPQPSVAQPKRSDGCLQRDIGVHKHLAFKKAQRTAKMEERIIKKLNDQQREANDDGVERTEVLFSKQPVETV